ncbi:MAG: hypothetical protein IPJ88_15205 [Myxococcales bacterium]|nr:MAG: hypothetical protein IPJ88_15205 [Myxococcales bacterium]
MTSIRALKTQGRIIKKAELESLEQAEQAIKDSEAFCKALRDKAEQSAEAIRKQARSEGLEQGRAQVASQLLVAQQLYANTLNDSEKDIVALCINIAAQIVQDEIVTRPEHIIPIAKQAIAQATQAKQLTLVVHPDDKSYLKGLVQKHAPAIHIECDASMSRGGCVVLSNIGDIDARLETRLSNLERQLLKS